MTSDRQRGPIFIVGCPRSGNTLLGCILNKHPELVVFLENHTFYSLHRSWKRRIASGEEPIEALVDQFMVGKKNWIENHTSLSLQPAELIRETRESLRENGWGGLLDAFMRALAQRVKPDFRRWGDKTPRNIAELGTIEETYPDSQIIFMYRDPRDVVSSLSRESFGHASDDPLICAEMVRQYWRVYEQEKAKIDPERLYEIRYESVVEQPEQTLRDLCDFLGLEFGNELLQAGPTGLRNRLGWQGNKAWEAIEPQPSSKRKAGSKWVEALLAERLEQLGYERMYDIDPATRTLAEAYTTPFRAVRPALQYMWRQRYPAGNHLLLHKLPKVEDFERWIQQEFTRRFA